MEVDKWNVSFFSVFLYLYHSVKAASCVRCLCESIFSERYASNAFDLISVYNVCVCVSAGAVGTPLPGVEVRIGMTNSTNTTIAEGNSKETRVSPPCSHLSSWSALAWRVTDGSLIALH